MPSKVAIIILNFNGKRDTTTCLQSLEKLSYSHTEIIIVDNGSTDSSLPYLRKRFPHLHFLETKENLGYAGGNNVGIDYALKKGADFLWILNNDTKVAHDSIEPMLKRFSNKKHLGIVGAKLVRMDQPYLLDHWGGKWDAKRLEFDFLGFKERAYSLPPKNLDYVCGAAMMVRREVFEKIGAFDPRFFLFWEEADFCFRAQKAGFALAVSHDSIVRHKISASLSGGKPQATYFDKRNRFLFIERNCTWRQKTRAFSQALLIDLPFFSAAFVFRSLQRAIQKFGRRSTKRNDDRLVRCSASIYAIRDYFLRDFGKGKSNKFIDCH